MAHIESDGMRKHTRLKNIVIVGGRLQGTEAALLGREAGFRVVLIDQDPMAPAQKLCTRFINKNVLSCDGEVLAALDAADLVLPTLENLPVLEGLQVLCERRGVRLAFDLSAYRISSSKKASDRLFDVLGLPRPKDWPQGNLPYIVKPDSESGSHGVLRLTTKEQLQRFLVDAEDSFIIQEYLEGRSYSIEIIGEPGNYRTYEPTEIFVDASFDCNLAAVYRTIAPEKKRALADYARRIAEGIGLCGILDLEVIDSKDGMKILEIDARLPSQTPLAVYYATGMNYIAELYDVFCRGGFRKRQTDAGRCASYTQYQIKHCAFVSLGERILTEGGVLRARRPRIRSARMITDYTRHTAVWRGIFITHADTAEQLRKREAAVRCGIVKQIRLERQ